jgi:hypothetical protein
MSRRSIINITMMPRRWPACIGARLHSNTYSACSALSSKAPPRVCCKPYPPLESIKGGARSSLGGTTDENEIDIFPTSEINISSNTPLYSFFETWDRFPLSWLVTPTQALRCKEIQYFPSLLDVGPSFARTRINPCVFSLHHHPK